ncbi:nucleotidyltransferase family protein [Citromicrobium bathyomarinum]|uniref:nucleotidyltransferase family protein n=1 Tax=Citromicrobium bathyomarinum TaxID=72174 RepID=UPI00315AE245
MDEASRRAHSQLFSWLCASNDEPASELTQAEWNWIAQVAREYRLRPLLHLRQRSGIGPSFPPVFSEECAQSFASQQVRWLDLKGGIVRTSRALSEANVPHVFLKGAALRLSVAAEPAVRPMRDLDILIPRDRSVAARDALTALGFHALPGDLETALDRGYQQPALIHSASGLAVELHHDLAALPSIDTASLAAFVRDSVEHVRLGGHPIPVSAPCATFLHLLLHAGPKSLFDCGPLLLADVAMLIERRVDRLGELYERAEQFGLLPTLALVLQLLERHGADTERLGLDSAHLPLVAETLVDHAEGLLVQPSRAVHQRKMVREARDDAGRLAGIDKAFARALMPSRAGIVATSGGRIEDRLLWLRYPHWLMKRAWQLLSGLRDRSLAGEVVRDRALAKFLLDDPAANRAE